MPYMTLESDLIRVHQQKTPHLVGERSQCKAHGLQFQADHSQAYAITCVHQQKLLPDLLARPPKHSSSHTHTHVNPDVLDIVAVKDMTLPVHLLFLHSDHLPVLIDITC